MAMLFNARGGSLQRQSKGAVTATFPRVLAIRNVMRLCAAAASRRRGSGIAGPLGSGKKEVS